MSRRQPHTTHRTRAPHAYRDAIPPRVQRRGTREASRAEDADAGRPKPERVSAQTVFFIARALAVLIAAIAAGLGGVSGQADTGTATNAPPTSSHATTR